MNDIALPDISSLKPQSAGPGHGRTPEARAAILMDMFRVRGEPEVWDGYIKTEASRFENTRKFRLWAYMSSLVALWAVTVLSHTHWFVANEGLDRTLFFSVLCISPILLFRGHRYFKSSLVDELEAKRNQIFEEWSYGMSNFSDIAYAFNRFQKHRTIAPALLAFASLASEMRPTSFNDKVMNNLRKRVGDEAMHSALTCFLKSYDALRYGAPKVSVTPEAEEHLFAVIEASHRPYGAHEVICDLRGEETVFPMTDRLEPQTA